MKKFIAIILAVVMVLGLAACNNNSLSGTWEHDGGDRILKIKFSGKKYTTTLIEKSQPYEDGSVREEKETITKGTYSITDDKIEFVTEDGVIYVESFSRTENTLTIGGMRLTKA